MSQAMVVAVGLLAGCAAQPRAAEHLTRLESEPKLDAQLSDAEQAELVAAMKSVAVDHQPGTDEKVLVREMRWSDLPAAVAVACDQPGVEMVVVRMDLLEHSLLFHLRTADDRPAWIEFLRTHDERLYESKVRVGRFNFEHDRVRGQRLREEVDRAMQRYSEKKRLPVEDD